MVGKEYCVYIMTNVHNTVLYTGVTKLVYYELTDNVYSALACEKQIKGGSRKKKIDLVNRLNPTWKDLYNEL